MFLPEQAIILYDYRFVVVIILEGIFVSSMVGYINWKNNNRTKSHFLGDKVKVNPEILKSSHKKL